MNQVSQNVDEEIHLDRYSILPLEVLEDEDEKKKIRNETIWPIASPRPQSRAKRNASSLVGQVASSFGKIGERMPGDFFMSP